MLFHLAHTTTNALQLTRRPSLLLALALQRSRERCSSMSQAVSGVGPQSRRAVAGLGRAELEDRHMSLMEENHLLKKHARSQEEKMKKMATKLLRLAADEKREAKREGQPPSVLQVKELEGDIQELMTKIRDLERTNTSLHNKIAVLRQQCDSKGKRRTPYDHVQSRITSSVGRRTQRASMQSSPATPRYGRSLLEEARRDNQELEDLVLRLKQEVSVLTAEAAKNQEQHTSHRETLKERKEISPNLRLQAAEHEEQRLSLEQQLQTLSTSQHKRGIEEDVDVIRVQREVREKSDRLLVLESQYAALERNLEAMRTNQTKLLQELEQLNTRLKEEQSRSVELQTRLNSHSLVQGRVAELEQTVSHQLAERDILKNTNDRLMKSAFTEDRGSEYRGQVRALQERIREFESGSHETHVTTNPPTVHTLHSEREVSQEIEREGASGAYTLIQTQHQQLRDKLMNKAPRPIVGGSIGSRTVRETGVDTEDISPNTALDKLEQHDKTDMRRELFELRLSTEETAAELEKTRHLLTAQRTVNQDYQKEIKALREEMCRLKTYRLPVRVSDLRPGSHDTPNNSCNSEGGHVWTAEKAVRQQSEENRRAAVNGDRHYQRMEERMATREGGQEGRRGRSEQQLSEIKYPSTPRVSTSNTDFTKPSKPLEPHHHQPTGGEERDSSRQGVLEQSAGCAMGDSRETEEPARPLSPPRLKTPANGSLGLQNLPAQETRGSRNNGRELSGSEDVVSEEEEVGEDVSVSSLTHSSSELGTPSTSTPLRPPLPPPPHGRTQDTLPPPPPLPPFSSSFSVIAPEVPAEDQSHLETVGVGGGGFVRMLGGGESGEEDGDSVSVTVTELSEEDEEEDTMFEETLPTGLALSLQEIIVPTESSTVSGRTLATPTTPTQPSVRLAASEEDEEESPPISPTLTSGVSPSATSLEEEEEGATPRQPHRDLPPVPQAREDVMCVCIERLSLEPGSSLAARQEDILGYFVEFQLLDYEFGDLETPSVPTPPHPSPQPVLFNFMKEFQVGPSQKALLISALNSSSADDPDRKVLFTVVSDPVEQERECEEVGTAELDLSIIHKSGKDIVNQQIQVLSCNEDAELLGRLTVSVSAAHILRNL